MGNKSTFGLESLMYGVDMIETDDSTLRSRVNLTLHRHPNLKEVYPPDRVEALIARRRDLSNYLLLLLANPGNHVAAKFWSEVAADLDLLEPEGAFSHYGTKFQVLDYPSLEVAKTELEVAAWMRRRGHVIELEPIIPGTERRGEFVARLSSTTWWEIKSVQDIEPVRVADRAYSEIVKRLRKIPEPYALSVEQGNIRPEDAHRATNYIRRKIRSFHNSGGGALPISFNACGMTVTLETRSGREYGYLGSSDNEFMFQNENLLKVRKRINSAVGQIPADAAGIVVIDATAAHWIDEEDVRQACFGEEVMRLASGKPIDALDFGAAFSAHNRTRISVVLSYKRQNEGLKLKRHRIVYHNPHAKHPMPIDYFGEDVSEQWTLIDRGHGWLWPCRLV